MKQKPPKWLDKQEYPFKNHYLKLPVGKMHYIDEGNGEPIIFLHGNPAWSFEFRNQIKALSMTKRCIAPDHIGFGLSDKPYDWTYYPEDHAKNFETFMNKLKLNNITLVVNDWGGPIGLSYALNYPKKIKKIIVLNTWMWSVKNDPYYQRFSNIMGGMIGRVLIKHFNFFGKVVVKQALGNKKSMTKEIHRHYYKHLKTKKDRKGSWTFPKHIIASSEWLDSLWKKRKQIQNIPTTIIWGMKDIAFREKELNTWEGLFLNKEVIKLQNVGHFPQEEAPDVLVKVLSK